MKRSRNWIVRNAWLSQGSDAVTNASEKFAECRPPPMVELECPKRTKQETNGRRIMHFVIGQ